MATITPSALSQWSDNDLVVHTQRAAQDERHATAHLIALLMELDARRLYLGEGFSSLFTYCTQALRLSEPAAFNRIKAARAARRFPIILDLLASGMVTLTTIRLLASHLTPENHRDVLERARHKSKGDIERLAASLHPQPAVPTAVRKLPTRSVFAGPATTAEEPRRMASTTAPSCAAPLSAISETRRPEVKPLAPERYKIQFTVTRETYERLRRAQDLLRHSVPNGDPAVIFERALALLVTELERTKIGATQRPQAARHTDAATRHIPAAVKRAVWKRDGGRCAFRGAHGQCAETGFLEYHHVVPFAAGGETSISNVALRCRAHNQYEADLFFGPAKPPVVREQRVAFGT
jgi:hypothetical protein